MPKTVIKIVNTNFQVRLQQNNKIVVINDKYNIHLRLHSLRRHGKYPLNCKIKDRKTGKTIFVKVFLLDEKPDLRDYKAKFLDYVVPNELKEIEEYVVGLSL